MTQSADLASSTELAPLTPGSTVEFRATEFAYAPMELTAEPGTYHGVRDRAHTVE